MRSKYRNCSRQDFSFTAKAVRTLIFSQEEIQPFTTGELHQPFTTGELPTPNGAGPGLDSVAVIGAGVISNQKPFVPLHWYTYF